MFTLYSGQLVNHCSRDMIIMCSVIWALFSTCFANFVNLSDNLISQWQRLVSTETLSSVTNHTYFYAAGISNFLKRSPALFSIVLNSNTFKFSSANVTAQVRRLRRRWRNRRTGTNRHSHRVLSRVKRHEFNWRVAKSILELYYTQLNEIMELKLQGMTESVVRCIFSLVFKCPGPKFFF